MLFFRLFQHLLPKSEAFGLTIDRTLRRFFEGLAVGFEDVREFTDAAYLDLFPETTRELQAWEQHFGLAQNAGSDADRRMALTASWQETGGQSPAYLTDVMRAAGFPVTFHPAALPGTDGGPDNVHDPRRFLARPVVGRVHCGGPDARCGNNVALCTGLRASAPGVAVAPLVYHHIANLSQSVDIQPSLPSSNQQWPFFLYVGGAEFGQPVNIPLSSKSEFERRLLKLRPSQAWIGVFVQYV